MSDVVGIHRGRVEWIDTDASGIYHNTAVARYVESAEAALMRDRGLNDYFVSAPRVHYEVDFCTPLAFGQEFVAEVRVAAMGTSSMTFAFEISRITERGLVRAARGSYTTVHLGSDGRSAPWPTPWREALTTTAQSVR